MLALIDPILVIAALVICAAGLGRRAKLWMMGRKTEEMKAFWRRCGDFIVYGILHGRIIREPYPGLMHLFIFFACLIPLLIIVCVQIKFSLPEVWGNGFSVLLDVLGTLGLLGIALAVFRRYVQKPDRLSDTRREDAVALLWVFAILFWRHDRNKAVIFRFHSGFVPFVSSVHNQNALYVLMAHRVQKSAARRSVVNIPASDRKCHSRSVR